MVNMLLMQVGTYVTGSGHLTQNQGSWSKPGGAVSHSIITTELWGSNNIYNQFSTMEIVDEIIKVNVSKAPQKAEN